VEVRWGAVRRGRARLGGGRGRRVRGVGGGVGGLLLHLSVVDLGEDERVLHLELFGLEDGIGRESLPRRRTQGKGQPSAMAALQSNRSRLTSSSFSLALRIILSSSASLFPSF